MCSLHSNKEMSPIGTSDKIVINVLDVCSRESPKKRGEMQLISNTNVTRNAGRGKDREVVNR